MSRAKKQVAVAGISLRDGSHIRIPLITVADMVHVFALAMGYKPVVAFAFGVISRTPEEVQGGSLDLTPELATKTIRIAQMLSECRKNACVPETQLDYDMVKSAAYHIHNVESVYTELCKAAPGMEATFEKQYADWSAWMLKREKKKNRVSVLKRLTNYVNSFFVPGQDR